MNIVSDFMADWSRIVLRALKAIDPQIDVTLSPQDLCFRFANWDKRQIAPGRRTIKLSKEFRCPINRALGLRQLKEKIQRGVNLRPHLSTSVMNLNFDDGLLNDWGIYHLHLGTRPHRRNPAFVERTDEVVMARFDDTTAYLIDVGHHGDWAQQRLLEIVHNNWPETIAQYKMKGIRLGHNIADNDRAKLRKGGVQAFTEIGDTVYFSPGGGYSTSGLSTEVVTMCDRIVYTLRGYEQHLQAHPEVVANAIGRSVDEAESVTLTMQTDFATVWAVVEGSGQTLRLGPLMS